MLNYIGNLFKKGMNALSIGGGSNYKVASPIDVLELQAKLAGASADKDDLPASTSLALALPVVTHAVDIISNMLAVCSRHSYEITDDGREFSDDPVDRLFNYDWNPFVNSIDGLQALIANCLLKGNGVALIDWNANEIRLDNLDPDFMDVTWEVDEKGRIADVYYLYNNNGTIIVIPKANIFHIKGMCVGNGIWGENPIRNLSGTFRTGYTLQAYTYKFFKEGSHQNKYLSVPAWLDDDQFDKVQQQMEVIKTGLETAGKWVVLQGGMTAQSLNLNNDEASLVECKKYTDEQLLKMFGLPMDYTPENYQIMKNTVFNKFLKKIEKEALLKLYTTDERKTHYLEFTREDMVSMDDKLKYEMLATGRQYGLISDIQAAEKLNQLKPATLAAKGHKFLVPANLVDPFAPIPTVSGPNTATPQGQTPSEAQNQPPEAQPPVKPPKDLDTVAEIRGQAVERWKYGCVANDFDLTTNVDDLAQYGDAVLDQIAVLDEEIKSVLPEQRLEILRQWKIKE